VPYIEKWRRDQLVENDYDLPSPTSPGDLNFVLTRMCLKYIKNVYGETRYTAINEVVGALECCKLEMYRRLAGPYEDSKAANNGDVY
jgi:hypothetical protein